MVFIETLSAVASIFLLLMAGYGAKKVGVLREQDVHVVNSLLINLSMPAFIFVNTHKKPLTMGMVKAPFVAFIMEIVVIGLAYLLARLLKLDRKTTGALMIVSAFGNTGFLGYPVTAAAFSGDKKAILTAVMIDNFGMALILYTVGVAIVTTFAGSEFKWKNVFEFLKTPMFPATIVALALRQVEIPSLVMDTLTFMGHATVPLAMISIGLSLKTTAVTKYPLPFLVATVLKMAVLPALVYFGLPYVGVEGTVRDVVTMECATPAAVMTGVISGKYGANHEFAAGTVFATTLISVISIPLLLSIIR